ncbi:MULTISPECIES: EpsG family protein [Cobetia]|uniref:EpsG family protein n=1 Tax=Cobetia TaxID=204286 RepID=UPI00098740F3|nr:MULTISPECIES: EpsG family protein [Cobetia]POR07012.1 hypothetical protein BOH68_05165 [Cobetia sp. MM1IDA2H-1]
MTYELVCYFSLFFVGLIYCFCSLSSKVLYFTSTLILLMINSAVMRYSGFDIDMNVYVSTLETNVISMYYLKEPIYWVISRYLYDLLGSPEVTFMVYDFLSFIAVLKARENIKLPQYFPFLFFLFFPSVMGINNVYRQYLSCCFFVYFMSLMYIEAGYLKRIYSLAFAFLTHNVAALFSPFLHAGTNRRNISYLTIFFYMAVLVLLPFSLDTKSSSDTGELGVSIYIVALFSFFMFYILSYRLKFDCNSKMVLHYFLFILCIMLLSAALMGGNQSKRVGMYSLALCLVFVVQAIEDNYKQVKITRATIYTILILPTVVFPSSLYMLTTGIN